jgi:hypothetical protein
MKGSYLFRPSKRRGHDQTAASRLAAEENFKILRLKGASAAIETIFPSLGMVYTSESIARCIKDAIFSIKTEQLRRKNAIQ